MKITQHGEFQIATRPAFSGEGYVAWARRGTILVDSPMREPSDVDVWFEFDLSEDEARTKLLMELGKSQGPNPLMIALGVMLGLAFVAALLGWLK